jgi:hypothetical protein
MTFRFEMHFSSIGLEAARTVNHQLVVTSGLQKVPRQLSFVWVTDIFVRSSTKKDKPLTFKSWRVDYLLDWLLYQLRSLMSYEVPYIWHLLSFTRLIVQFMSIVSVYNIFIGCVCILHTLPVALFLFDSRNANWVLLDHGKLCFYHAISMRLTNIYILLYSVSTKNCIDAIVLVVHCCWRRIEPILISFWCFLTTFWSYFAKQQFGLCCVDASIVCIILLK